MMKFDVFNPLANVTFKLTAEQIAEISEWFDEHSKPLLIINEEATNVVTIDDLRQFLALKKFHRRSFHYPSYGEIMTEAETLKAGVTRMLTKDQVLYILNTCVLMPNIRHELKLAFKVFDTEKRDFLDIEELQTIVTNYADVFSDAEAIEMLRDANVRGDGNVFYEDFIESLFNLAPELYDIKVEFLYDDPDEDPSMPPEPVEEPPVVEQEIPPPPPPQPQPKIKPAKGKKK